MSSATERLRELLDEIEREHARVVEEAQMNAIYLPSRRVALPLDADGLPIDIGDEMYPVDDMPKHHGPVEFMTLTEKGWWIDGDCDPSKLRHFEEPTVEDVLREFRDELRDAPDDAIAELTARYARRAREAAEHA